MELHTQTNVKSKPSLHFAPQNPVHALYKSKAAEVLATRTALYSELRTMSPRVADIVETFCNSKLPNDQDPHLGEMLPWLIADLGMVSDTRMNHVAVGWLGVYVYGLLIDERADEGERLNSTEQLASLLLLHTGLDHLHRALQNSPFQAVFSRHLAIAVEGQLTDIHENSAVETVDRRAYTIAKNSCLVCAAAAVAALSPRSGEPLVGMVEDLRLALQYLDDLGDWRHDAAANNHTIVLTSALAFASEKGWTGQSLSDYVEEDLLGLMIESGALESALAVIAQSLDGQSHLLGDGSTDTPSAQFFRDLRRHVESARLAVGVARAKLPGARLVGRKKILDRIDQHLRIIAQGT